MTPSPSPALATFADQATAVQVWTLILAAMAVAATLVSAYLLRRTGVGQVDAAKQAASASQKSAEAAQKSAQAALEAVRITRAKAIGDLVATLGSSDSRQVEASLIVMGYVDKELAQEIGDLYRTAGGIGALKELAQSAEPEVRQPASTSLRALLDRFKKSVFRLEDPLNNSSVAWLGAEHLLVTLHYLIEHQNELLTTAFDGQSHNVSIVESGSEDQPVSVLATSSDAIPLTMSASASPQPNEPATLLRYLRGRNELSAEAVSIVGMRSNGDLLLEGDFGTDCAGAPVVGPSGLVVGMLYKRETSGPNRTSRGVAISAKRVTDVLMRVQAPS